MDRIATPITEMLGIRYPIVAAPMFLASTPALLEAVARAGGIGAIPTLNFRTGEAFRRFLETFPEELPFGVNLILRREENPRLEEDLAAILERRVPLVITSLGDPTRVIEAVHAYGGRVFCDVVGMRHARKAAQAGADALIAVACGAGGHAGTISPLVLGPWLKAELGVPVLAAGGIGDGRGLLAVLALGLDGAYIGTRFLASEEAAIPAEYKAAVVQASPEEIVYTPEVSGIPANFLRSSLERYRREGGKRWKDVWSAGHGVGLIREVQPAAEIVRQIVEEYREAKARLP